MNNKYKIGEKVMITKLGLQQGESPTEELKVVECRGVHYRVEKLNGFQIVVEERYLTPYIEEDTTREWKIHILNDDGKQIIEYTEYEGEHEDCVVCHEFETNMSKEQILKVLDINDKFPLQDTQEPMVKSDIGLFDTQEDNAKNEWQCINCGKKTNVYPKGEQYCKECLECLDIILSTPIRKGTYNDGSLSNVMNEAHFDPIGTQAPVGLDYKKEYNLLLEKHAETKELLEIAKISIKMLSELIPSELI